MKKNKVERKKKKNSHPPQPQIKQKNKKIWMTIFAASLIDVVVDFDEIDKWFVALRESYVYPLKADPGSIDFSNRIAVDDKAKKVFFFLCIIFWGGGEEEGGCPAGGAGVGREIFALDFFFSDGCFFFFCVVVQCGGQK